MEPLLRAGIPYEIAGLIYFGFYLVMSRPGGKTRFSTRSKLLTLLAAIVLVGAVPLHYGENALAIVAVLGFAVMALLSAILDRRAA